MLVLDPSGFQMAAVIVAGGTRYPLWLTPQTDNPGAIDELTNGLPIVESVDIEIALGLNSKVTLTVAADYDIGMRIIESDLLRIGNVLEVQIGYPRLGRFTPWISSLMVQPSLRITPDEGFSATINGEGGAFAALRGSRSTQYQNTTYAEIIRQIGESDDYRFIVQLPEQNGSNDPLYRQRVSVSQSNQADWFFLQGLVRASNCDAWMEPSRDEPGRQVLAVHRRSTALGAAPRFTFVMRGNVDFDTTFPIMEFESNMEGIWLPGAGTSVRTTMVNPDTLETTDLIATPQTTDVPATGDAVPSDGGTRIEDTEVRLTPARADDVAGDFLYTGDRDHRGGADQIASHQTEGALRGSVQADITTIGIPDLFPGELVPIANFGIFNGLYLVEKVTHRCAPGEWTLSAHILNNATTTSFLIEALSGFPARVNEETAPLPTGDAVGGGTEVEPEAPEA